MTTLCVNILFLLREPDILETEVFVFHVVNPVGKEPRMKSSEFEQWCDRLQLPMSTRDLLPGFRSSPPARQVQGRLLNVSGTYASRKKCDALDGTRNSLGTRPEKRVVYSQADQRPQVI